MTFKPQVILAVLLMVILLCIGLFDLWAIASGYPRSTVSAIVQDWSREFPIIPVVFGFVSGHLFWPVR